MGQINRPVAAGIPTQSAKESFKPMSIALDLKFGIMKGRRYLNAMNWARTFFFGAKDIEVMAEELLIKFMLDPDAARIALRSPTDKVAQRRLKTYITNNILSQPSDEERRQRLLESQEPVRAAAEWEARP